MIRYIIHIISVIDEGNLRLFVENPEGKAEIIYIFDEDFKKIEFRTNTESYVIISDDEEVVELVIKKD